MTTLVLERTLAAPIATVFDFVTREKNLLEWWGPEGMTVPEGELDFTRPGPWFSVMQNAEGRRFKVSGQVTTVSAFDRVAFTWAWHDENDRRGPESQVVIALTEEGDDRTRLVLTHTDLADDESARNHEMGWTSSLRKLERKFPDRN